MPLEDAESNVIGEMLEQHNKAGEDELRRSRIPEDCMMFPTYLDCMYQGQGYELRIEFKGVHEDWKKEVMEAFVKRHMEEYGHAKVDPIKIVNVRLDAVGVVPKAKSIEIEEGNTDASHAIRCNDRVYFGTAKELEVEEIPRYEYEELKANNIIVGPAIVDEMDSTTVIKKGWQAVVTRNGYMVISARELE
jgi:N-methylhydantoinase A